MNSGNRKSRSGFTLTELAIVLGIVGAIMGGIWFITSAAQQKARLAVSVEAIASTVEGVRALYGGQGSIAGGISILVPILTAHNIIPSGFIDVTGTTTCSGVTNSFANAPLSQNHQVSDGCGNFRVCGWAYGADAACNPTTANPVQYFAIEFADLSYGSCAALATAISPKTPNGLVDVYINRASMVANGLPVPAASAEAACVGGSVTNTVDFLYRLRPPAY